MALRVPIGPELNPCVGKEVMGLLLEPQRVMAVDEIEACLVRRCRFELFGPGLNQADIFKRNQCQFETAGDPAVGWKWCACLRGGQAGRFIAIQQG